MTGGSIVRFLVRRTNQFGGSTLLTVMATPPAGLPTLLKVAVARVQLLQLQDFPGQGEALIGLLDSFWETKGILEPDEMRGFFGETVALARFEKHVWTNDETFAAKVQLAHYGHLAPHSPLPVTA